MAGAFGLALAACGGDTTKAAVSIPPAGSDLGAVEHVVFLMNENRSFDHYYGTYPGVRGFDDPDRARRRLQPAVAAGRARALGYLAPALPSRHRHDRRRVHLRPLPRVERPAPLLERGPDGPLRVHPHLAPVRRTRERRPHDGLLHAPGPPVLVLAGRRLHHLRQLPLLGVRSHPPEPSPRVVRHARPRRGSRGPGDRHQQRGEVHRQRRRGGRCPRSSRPRASPGRSTTRPESFYQPSNPYSLAISATTSFCTSTSTSRTPVSPLYRNAFSPIFPKDFRRDVAKGELPAVSWIIPPVGYDEHPPAPPAAGQWFANQVIDVARLEPEGLVEDSAVHHVRRERRVLRPCPAPGARPRGPPVST